MDLTRFHKLKDPSFIRKEIFGDESDDIFVVGMVAAFEARKDYKNTDQSCSFVACFFQRLHTIYFNRRWNRLPMR